MWITSLSMTNMKSTLIYNNKFQFAYIQKQGYVDNGAYINYTINENKATDRRLVLKNMDYKRVTAILSGPAVTFLCDL